MALVKKRLKIGLNTVLTTHFLINSKNSKKTEQNKSNKD